MKDYFNQAIADGLNELGYGVDIPNDKGEMKFGPECHEVATIAEKLNELIESWSVVYGEHSEINGGAAKFGTSQVSSDNYQARLAFITPIEREPCKHEPYVHIDMVTHAYQKITKCKHCGVELTATWSAKEPK